MSIFSSIKGFDGELTGWLSKKLFLDSEIYKDFNNVTINTNSGTTQIDQIIVSKFGIFVIEVKNLKGWIFGDEKAAKWTQALNGKKYQFQNPLRQNFRHTKALSAFLGIDHSKIYSVVMFWGECEFKTPMPENVMMRGWTKYVKSKSKIMFTDDEVVQIGEAIMTGRLPATWNTKKAHLQSLKERHQDDGVCPKCGRGLVLRTVRKGPEIGSQFYGCSGFPQCHFTKAAKIANG
ncbi:MAG: NERD domain-containing protein [Desulfobacterales bacterium]|jgi:hypothetical protein|nr:NERD domain-containing protein [Desulfobacterales bacterium]